MVRLSLAARIATAAVVCLLYASATPAYKAVANAADVKVLATVALDAALNEIVPAFERVSGTKVVVDYGVSAQVKNRILRGERADVIVLTRTAMNDLEKQNKLVPGSLASVGGTPVSVVVRAGASKPDISSVDALKQTLLSAKSIVYADPAKGGASGVHFARVLDRLGLANQLRAKTILVPGPQAAEMVAKGKAELGIVEASAIVTVNGAQLVGPLPSEVASTIEIVAGIGADAQSPEAAKAFIQFIKGPTAAPILKAKGFAPN